MTTNLLLLIKLANALAILEDKQELVKSAGLFSRFPSVSNKVNAGYAIDGMAQLTKMLNKSFMTEEALGRGIRNILVSGRPLNKVFPKAVPFLKDLNVASPEAAGALSYLYPSIPGYLNDLGGMFGSKAAKSLYTRLLVGIPAYGIPAYAITHPTQTKEFFSGE